eukprot:3310907-Amphidinium_carterae.1
MPKRQAVDKAEQSAVRNSVALFLDNRRMESDDSNANYVRAICTGSRPEDTFTSRVVVLGRGMDNTSELELDLASVPSIERGKVQRVLDNRSTKRRAEEDSLKAPLKKSKQSAVQDSEEVVQPEPPTPE